MADSQGSSCTSTLIAEIISLKDTLRAHDKHETKSMSSLSDHAKRISELLQIQSFDQCLPFHELLSVGPLKNTEIPLDILEMLASKCDVNQCNDSEQTCLQIAIENEHYNSVRWLVKHGADKNKALHSDKYRPSHVKTNPIASLAEQSNVPLDLFDLLHTPQNLNDVSYIPLPLHAAVYSGHADAALHLIQLGASVDIEDSDGFLPIEYYQMKYIHHNELFKNLVPTKRIDILKSIARIVDDCNESTYNFGIKCNMFCHLVQRLSERYALRGHHRHNRDMEIIRDLMVNYQLFKGMYLLTLLVFYLDWNIVSTPEAITPRLHNSATEQDMLYARAIDAIWKNHLCKPNVKSLLTLCIQQSRKHMINLKDSSFMSLPVPSYIRRLLMYRDVADKVCEAWRLWPECIPFDK